MLSIDRYPFLGGERFLLSVPPPTGLPALPHGRAVVSECRLVGAERLNFLIASMLAVVPTQCFFRLILAKRRLVQAKKDKKRLKQLGKKSKKAAIRTQAIVRGFIQRPKFKVALAKKEEEDLANQLNQMQGKIARSRGGTQTGTRGCQIRIRTRDGRVQGKARGSATCRGRKAKQVRATAKAHRRVPPTVKNSSPIYSLHCLNFFP